MLKSTLRREDSFEKGPPYILGGDSDVIGGHHKESEG